MYSVVFRGSRVTELHVGGVGGVGGGLTAHLSRRSVSRKNVSKAQKRNSQMVFIPE